eukprot:IDg7300t1
MRVVPDCGISEVPIIGINSEAEREISCVLASCGELFDMDEFEVVEYDRSMGFITSSNMSGRALCSVYLFDGVGMDLCSWICTFCGMVVCLGSLFGDAELREPELLTLAFMLIRQIILGVLCPLGTDVGDKGGIPPRQLLVYMLARQEHRTL